MILCLVMKNSDVVRTAMKRCRTCRETRPAAQFYAHNEHADSLSTSCRLCVRARQRARFATDTVKRSRREYYARNKGRICEQRRKYYATNAEQICAKVRAWNAANRDKVRASIKRSALMSRQKDPKAHWARISFSGLSGKARRRGTIRSKELEIDTPDSCPICHRRIDYTRRTVGRDSPSLDRVIPARGYVPGNVYTICNDCNRRKQDSTLAQLLAIMRYIVSRSTAGATLSEDDAASVERLFREYRKV